MKTSFKHTRVLTPAEENWNALSHAIGLVLSLLGCVLLFVVAAGPLSAGRILILLVFGFSLTALYLASTLYHAAKEELRKRRLKYCDHAAIFLLIAGTYTPFCLIGTKSGEGEVLALTVWALAGIGIVSKLFLLGRYRFVSTLMYLFMGWLAILHFDFLQGLPPEELNWLLWGGLSYSVGTIFYLWRSLPFSHTIWHLFVLGGSACHYLGVLLHVSA